MFIFTIFSLHVINLDTNLCDVLFKVEFHGLDGYGGPLYIGSGCFHRRDILSGRKFGEECKKEERREDGNELKSIFELEETSKALASCTYEENTQWGNEVCHLLLLHFKLRLLSYET